MRRLDLMPYHVLLTRPDPDRPTVLTKVETPFDVPGSLVGVLFGKGADGRELLRRDAIAKKIESGGRTVLLEEQEYQTLLQAFRGWETFGRHDVELIRRVEEAETVTVADIPGKKRHRG
jgi:hypothetical protein